MKRVVILGAVLSLLLLAAHPAQAQSNQLLQGTQLRLVLLNGLSTSVAKDGDPFMATVAEPVYIGSQLILPAGARVTGEIGHVVRSRRLPLFRGQASMNLTFKSIQVDQREIPVQMSILLIQDGSAHNAGKKRKDIKVEEGQVLEARTDIKKDAAIVGVGTAGGTVIGAVFSHVVRGFGFGLAGSAAYVIVRKGRDVELPAQTSFLVRLDSTVAVPRVSAQLAAPGAAATP